MCSLHKEWSQKLPLRLIRSRITWAKLSFCSKRFTLRALPNRILAQTRVQEEQVKVCKKLEFKLCKMKTKTKLITNNLSLNFNSKLLPCSNWELIKLSHSPYPTRMWFWINTSRSWAILMIFQLVKSRIWSAIRPIKACMRVTWDFQ